MEQFIDFVELEEKYGAELAEEIKSDLDFANKNNHEWKFEIIDEGKNVVSLAFVHHFSTCVYEVSKRRKVIVEKYILGKFNCEKLHSLMSSFDKV